MISRLGVVCAGCDARILLRLSIGIDTCQPFFFVCRACGTPTRATLRITYGEHPSAKLELEAGEEFDERDKEPLQVINVAPEFPAIPNATSIGDEGGSPFIHQHQLTGGQIKELMDSTALFRGVVDNDWQTFRRFARFYNLEDWNRFDDHGKKMLSDWPKLKTDLQRHDLFHRLVLLLFKPILIPPFVPECVAEFNGKMSRIPLNRTVRDFCRAQVKSGLVAQLHNDVFARLDFVAQHKSSMLAVLPLEFYVKGPEHAVLDLRLFRDEFSLLKMHYIDSYEIAHKVLTLIVGLLNCIERGDAVSYDPNVTGPLVQAGMKGFGKFGDLAKFEKLPNAPKKSFLASLPQWKALWEEMLDPKLRNPIGHNSARHDLASGNIVIDGGASVPYLKFAFETFRLTHLLILLLHVLKMIRIASGSEVESIPSSK